MHYKAIAFDYDYTLVDATQGIADSINYALERAGLPPMEHSELRPYVGIPIEQIFRSRSSVCDEQQLERLVADFFDKAGTTMTRGTELLPHTDAAIRSLHERGFILAIVSTKRTDRLAEGLEKFGLRGCFSLLIGGDMVRRHKPDPQGLLDVLEQTGLSREEALFVGDTTIDAQTAQNAGVDFCAVTSGATPAAHFDAYPRVLLCGDLRELHRELTGSEPPPCGA